MTNSNLDIETYRLNMSAKRFKLLRCRIKLILRQRFKPMRYEPPFKFIYSGQNSFIFILMIWKKTKGSKFSMISAWAYNWCHYLQAHALISETRLFSLKAHALINLVSQLIAHVPLKNFPLEACASREFSLRSMRLLLILLKNFFGLKAYRNFVATTV